MVEKSWISNQTTPTKVHSI